MSQINSRVPQSMRHHDTITRVYKNSSNQIVAIQTIEVLAENLAHPRPGFAPHSEGTQRFLRRGKIDVSTSLFNRGSSEDRVIANILQFGRYDTFENEGNNVVRVVYNGNNEVNDLIIDLNNLPAIGDSF